MITGSLITLLFLGLFVHRPAFVTFLDQKLYDVFHKSLEDQGEAQPVIVDIDDPTLETYGQWPWPRDLLAELCEAILKGSPSVVGLDILLSEPDRYSLAVAVQALQKKTLIPECSLPPDMAKRLDNDQILAEALQKGYFVLACKLLPQKSVDVPRTLSPLKITRMTDTPETDLFQRFPKMHTRLLPLPRLLGAAPGYGVVNAIADSDGIIRKTPFITAYKEQFYPSLALATLMAAMHTDSVLLKADSQGLVSVSVNRHTVPVDNRGQMLLNFRRSASGFRVISAADLLNGSADLSILNQKIVLVGTSAAGLGDTHTTPLASYFPGVKIHATAVDNVLNGNFLSRPAWAEGVELLLVFSTGLFCTLILTNFTPIACVLYLLGSAAMFWFLGAFFLGRMHIFISMAYPFLTLFCTFSLLSAARFRLEERRTLKRTRDMVAAQNLTLLGITSLAATRDRETGLHIQRSALFVKLLARQLSRHPRYRQILDRDTVELMFKSAPMHDIGKVGVPDAVLRKPGKLTQKEFEEIQKHTEYGWNAIEEAEKTAGKAQGASFLKIAKEIILYHHEKWDGSGYNRGLSGEQIPLSARIMAVADVYDALTARRVYKDAFDHKKAIDIISKGKGIHFDPDVVDALIKLQDEFKDIAIKMADPPSE